MIVPILEQDFTEDIEDLVVPHLFQKWSLVEPQKGTAEVDQNASISFRPGFFNGSKPYEVCVIQTNTVAEKKTQGQYIFLTNLEIMQKARRLTTGDDPTKPLEMLKKMEEEIRRIILAYNENEIPGIDNLIYNGYEMYYNHDDTYAKSEWSLSTKVSAFYQKVVS